MKTDTQTKDRQACAEDNKKLAFNVIAEDDSGKLMFYLQPTNGLSQPYLKGKKITFPNGPDWYEVDFHLVDNAKQKIDFDQTQPFCAQVGAGCPPNGSGNKSEGQLSQLSISSNKLTLLNKNQDPPRELGYILCFVDANTGAPIEPFDPIMENGGGGREPFING